MVKNQSSETSEKKPETPKGIVGSVRAYWVKFSQWTGNATLAFAVLVLIINLFYDDIPLEGLKISDLDIITQEKSPPLTPTRDWSQIRVNSYIKLVEASSPNNFCNPSLSKKIWRKFFNKEASSEIMVFDTDDPNVLSKILLRTSVCDDELNIPKSALDIYDGPYLSDLNSGGMNLQLTYKNTVKPTSIFGEAMRLIKWRSFSADKSIVQISQDKTNTVNNKIIDLSKNEFPTKMLVEVTFEGINQPLKYEIINTISTIDNDFYPNAVEDRNRDNGKNNETETPTDIETATNGQTSNDWAQFCDSQIPDVECSFDRLVKFWRAKKGEAPISRLPYFENDKVFVSNKVQGSSPFLVNLIYPEKNRAELGMEQDLVALRSVTPEPHRLDNEKKRTWFDVEPSADANYDYSAYTTLAFTPENHPSDCKVMSGEGFQLSESDPSTRCQFFYHILFNVVSPAECGEIKAPLNQVSEACKINRILFVRKTENDFLCAYRKKYGESAATKLAICNSNKVKT